MSNSAEKNSTISTQIISASLTMITVLGAFAVFIIEKRQVGFWYYLIVSLAFFSFVISIFLGGKGLSGKGEKEKSKSNPYFNWQAIMALFGVILFCSSIFLGKKIPDELEKKIYDQQKEIIILKTKDEFRNKDIQKLEDNVTILRKQIDSLNKTILPSTHH